MPAQRTLLALVPLGVAALLGACKGATEVCTDPLTCDGVTGVTVTSAVVDSVMAVGRTAQLTASAVSGSTPVTVSFSWTSSNTAAATVAPGTGLVTGVAAGTANITAAQNNNAQTGTLRMRVVAANLPVVTALVGDSLSVRLRQALSSTPQAQMAGQLTSCSPNIGTGNLLALNTCLTGLTNVSGGSNGNDNALLNVLDLIYEHAKRQLQL